MLDSASRPGNVAVLVSPIPGPVDDTTELLPIAVADRLGPRLAVGVDVAAGVGCASSTGWKMCF